MKKDLRSLNLLEMQDLMEEIGVPLFRAKQLSEWIHKKGIESFSEISNFNKELKEMLATKSKIAGLKLIKSQVSIDDTRKYLFQLEDDHYIECVLMRYRGTRSKQRNTLCVSSQVGCAMGCGFCATGQGGFYRNLTTGEILSQVYTINSLLAKEDVEERVGNVVYMGMGEPLLNFDNTLKSIGLLNEPYGQNISRRRITISTCGIVPKIISLADLKLDVVLAVSLHAPTDSLRSQMMPVNLQYPLAKLKEACLYYVRKTQRRITFEYALVKDFNDTQEHALQLACFLKGLLCHVNLIPVNPTSADYQRPAKAKLQNFLGALTNAGIEATIREEKGTDILAACGQLRGKVVE